MSQPAMTKADKKAKKNEFVETIIVIVEALLIALVFRTFLYQPFSIPSASMQSTLMVGDYFLASKFTWGLGKYSFPIPLPFNGRILQLSQPQQGDVAVFHNGPTDQDFIKRIIGMPGDHIQMKQGRLYINGKMLDRQLVGQGVDHTESGDFNVQVYNETLPNGVVHPIQEQSDTEALDNTDEYVVPAGHYFMMGDNRDDSSDSRVLSEVGYVPADNLIGKAEVRFFSIKDNQPPWAFWTWPTSIRWDRMFQSVYQNYTTTPAL